MSILNFCVSYIVFKQRNLPQQKIGKRALARLINGQKFPSPTSTRGILHASNYTVAKNIIKVPDPLIQ